MRHKRSGDVVAAIPRYRPQTGPVVLSAGFWPFFLLASFWASLAIPISLAFFTGHSQVPTALSPVIWHVHEMIFGFGAATVAGFLLTAIPNRTGRMPLQGGPLAFLVLLWAVGRVAVLAKTAPRKASRQGVPVIEDTIIDVVDEAIRAKNVNLKFLQAAIRRASSLVSSLGY